MYANTRTNSRTDFPQHTLLRRQRMQQKCRALRLTDAQYRSLAEEIAQRLTDGKYRDELLYGNRVYCFNAEVAENSQITYTGVEWLGRRESHIETKLQLRSLSIEGVYSPGGTPIEADIDSQKIERIIQSMELQIN